MAVFPWLTQLCRSHFHLVFSVTRYHSAKFSDSAWGEGEGQGGEENKQVEVVEGLFLESSPDSDFISADIRSLIQTPLHPICSSSSRIQPGRLQQILSDKCIDCIFQFLWKQQYCSDVFGRVFLSADYAQFTGPWAALFYRERFVSCNLCRVHAMCPAIAPSSNQFQ